LNDAQLGELLHAFRCSKRRGAKRFLHSINAPSQSADLDGYLIAAESNANAAAIADRLDRTREIKMQRISQGTDADVAEIIATICEQMSANGITQTQIANECGWGQPMVSQYLTGEREPGIVNACKLARAVGLTLIATGSKKSE
ncbi:MAG: helix-turn-helix transcriptional regulator, partial [Planctomycetota bacterium]